MKVDSEKQAFAARLNEALDNIGVPKKHDGRQGAVGKMFEVSQKGARKWLEGEGFPTVDICIAIATRTGVHYEWLMTGRGPKFLASEKPRDLIEDLPSSIQQETLDFVRFKVERELQGEQLGRYLKWIDRIKADRRSKPE
jgi:hypothetical protein